MSAGIALTVLLPRSEPEVLFVPEGDPEGLDRWAGVLLGASGRFDELADEAEQLRRPAWKGEGAQAYVDATGRAVEQARRTGRAARRVARVVLAVADRLREHQRTHQDLVDRKLRLDAQLEQLAALVGSGAVVTPREAQGLQDEADDLARRFKELVEEDRRLRRLVTTDEQLLAETFESATALEDVHALDGGRSDVAQEAMRRPGAPGEGVDPQRVRQWWRELSPAEQRAVVSAYPYKIAAAEGIPQDARELAAEIRDEEQFVRLRGKQADGTLDPDEARLLAQARGSQR